MKRRIMFVDPIAESNEYYKFMMKYLGKDFDICVCTSGKECKNEVYLFNPDFIYISSHLKDENPISLLQDIRIFRGRTAAIIGVDPDTTYYIRQLRDLNVYRALIAPYSLEEIGRQVCEIATFAYPLDNDYIIEVLDYILLRLGVKCCGSKYECICYAVQLKLKDSMIAAMKELYPALAKRVNGTIDSVEKGMRDAIRTARNASESDYWNVIFPNNKASGGLTNEDFINRLVIAVRHNQRPSISEEEFLSGQSQII